MKERITKKAKGIIGIHRCVSLNGCYLAFNICVMVFVHQTFYTFNFRYLKCHILQSIFDLLFYVCLASQMKVDNTARTSLTTC